MTRSSPKPGFHFALTIGEGLLEQDFGWVLITRREELINFCALTRPTHRCYDGRPALSYDEELSKNPLMIAYILWIFLIGVLGLVDPMSIVP